MLLDYVKKLEYKFELERLNALKQILQSKKMHYIEQKYKYMASHGTNIIIDIGKSKKHIILSAHHDVVYHSPGANDDASGVAILIDVIDKLRKLKLNNKVRIIFFDDEESGRFGSMSYIAEYGIQDLLGVYHLELCGSGDIVGLWPISKWNKESSVLKAIEEVLKEKNIFCEELGQLPAFYGDDLSFRAVGFANAVCISVATSEDRESIKKFVNKTFFRIALDFFAGRLPKLFQRYHSKEDKSEYLSEGTLRMMSEVMIDAVKKMDKSK